MDLNSKFSKESNKLILLLILVNSLLGMVFYSIIPKLLNYPELLLNTFLDQKYSGLTYDTRTILFIIGINIVSVAVLKILFIYLEMLYKKGMENQENVILKLRGILINGPYIFQFLHLIIMSISIFVTVAIYTKFDFGLTIKISTVFLIFITTSTQIVVIYSKKVFSKILLELFPNNDENNFLRINLLHKNILHVLPLLMVSMIFVAMVGYSEITREKGKLIYDYYSYELNQLENKVNKIKKTEDLFYEIKLRKEDKELGLTLFAISKSGKVFTSDNSKLSAFFLDYLKEISKKDGYRIFDYYGTGYEGVAKELTINGEEFILGVKYKVQPQKALTFFIITFFVFLTLNIVIIIYFSQALSEDIVLVSSKLKEIAGSDNIDFDNKIPVTSNDEIGDLVISLNRIMDKEKENMENIRKNQNILLEQERLVALGNLIGGIAHNIRTPVMAVSGAVEGLTELVNEYKMSIGDNEVTVEDHKEIAKEMLEWIPKIKSHCAYVSDIIAAVKDQATHLNTTSEGSFYVEELIKRVQLLMKHGLKMNNCNLLVENFVSSEVKAKGELTGMVQVINNLIENAIDAYEGERGDIKLEIKDDENKVLFLVRDNGAGISKEVKDKIFKEMHTSKGKKGTGLGLYMSYSTIIGKFGGNMWFESEEGKGTTFYISLSK